tara:strand:+ start:356 stop:835 length:480 start_codon:yes stop_codon:yes gene_type:complete
MSETDTIEGEGEEKPKTLSQRRKNRIAVIQFLYMWEYNPAEILGMALKEFFEKEEEEREYYQFAEELIIGVNQSAKEIDTIIRDHAKNWDFNRIGKVNLAILRLSVYEIIYRNDIPPVVTMNEAIELTKLLSEEDSKRFINGILDKISKKQKRPLREAL